MNHDPENQNEIGAEELTERLRILDLWRQLEPADPADAVPHTLTARVPGRAIGASVRGYSHAHDGRWREDAFAIDEADGWLLVAVCDGAGSAELSRVGAATAASAAVAALHRYLPRLRPELDAQHRLRADHGLELREYFVAATDSARAAIVREAERRQRAPRELAATLLLAAHRRVGGLDLVAGLQIGDGCLVLATDDRPACLLTRPDHDSHGSGTLFLTSSSRLIGPLRARFRHTVTALRCAAVMTDGVAEDFYPAESRMPQLFDGDPITRLMQADGAPLGGVMKRVVPAPAPTRSLESWLAYDSPDSFDDRTLVLMLGGCQGGYGEID